MDGSSKVFVAVSGGFDPVHPGHIDLFREAKSLGTYLIVLLNSDQFLIDKKGKFLMPFEDRKTILKSIKYIDSVVPVIDEDHTVRETLKKINPDIFANGGDRKSDNVPEVEVCNELGIKMVWNVGGEKTKSSSWYLDEYIRNS